jgi:hypothetical protein
MGLSAAGSEVNVLGAEMELDGTAEAGTLGIDVLLILATRMARNRSRTRVWIAGVG